VPDLKILLVNPPDRTVSSDPLALVPLGLAYVAAATRRRGYRDVSILDACGERLSWEDFQRRISVRKWDVIGLTSVTPVFDLVQRAMAVCRPHARCLVLGGPHPTAFADTIVPDNPELDCAVIGEGERTFVDMLDAVVSGGDLSGIPGLATPDSPASSRKLIEPLDELPFPARDLLPNECYRYALSGRRRATTIITSRGCPYDCIFCSNGVCGKQWRARSAANVLAEIDETVNRYGARYLIVYDDLFCMDRNRVRRICEGLIERNYPLKWKAEARVDSVDAEMLSWMRRAGCQVLAFGVESVNQHGLDYLRKNITPPMANEAFRLTRAAGIKTIGYFILGIPVETYEDALNTIRFAVDLKADYADFHVLSPLPGTRLYEDAVASGCYGEVDADSFTEKDRKRPVMISDNWSEEKLISILGEAYGRFFLRPGYVLRKLLSIRSLGEALSLMKWGGGVLAFVRNKRKRLILRG